MTRVRELNIYRYIYVYVHIYVHTQIALAMTLVRELNIYRYTYVYVCVFIHRDNGHDPSSWANGSGHTLQHTGSHCNTLQHIARCNTLQHSATHCNTDSNGHDPSSWANGSGHTLQHTATHCNTLQHAATQIAMAMTRVRELMGVDWLKALPPDIAVVKRHIQLCGYVCTNMNQKTHTGVWTCV